MKRKSLLKINNSAIVSLENKNRVLTICFLLVFMCRINGQSPSSIRKYIPQIPIDSLDLSKDNNGIILYSRSKTYLYNLEEIKEEKVIFPLLNIQPAFFYGDSTIFASVSYKNGYLLSMQEGLFYYKNDSLREWSTPFNTLNGPIKKITTCDDNFYLNINDKLYLWDHSMYGFTTVLNQVSLIDITATCDSWGFTWATDGEVLYRLGTSNSYPPSLFRLGPNNQKLILKEKDNLSIDLLGYHPEMQSLVLEFRVEGLHSEWQKYKMGTSVSLPLEPGDYKLLSRASIDGKYYAYGGPVTISKKRPNPLSPLWWLLSIPVSILLLSAFFIRRENQFKVKIQSEKEKNKMLQDLREWQEQAQQLQMNPHFLFNSLNSITALISLGENIKARKYLNQFASMMRSVLNNSIQKSIPLDNEVKYLKDYLDLEKFTRGNSFQYEIRNNIEEDLQVPPMLIQPFIENAIVHGFKGIEYDGKLTIEFTEEGKYLKVIIEDNGVGIEQSKRLKAGKGQHASIAMELTQKRLNNISKFVKGKMEVIDLSSIDQAKSGTRILLHIPC